MDLNDNSQYDETETILGQSHHYETTALSGFISNKTDFSSPVQIPGTSWAKLYQGNAGSPIALQKDG